MIVHPDHVGVHVTVCVYCTIYILHCTSEIMIHHEKIPFVEHYKYLGITLDNNLNFQKHMTEVCSIVAHKLYVLSQIRTFMSRQAALTVFKAKVLPFFDYGDILYMGTNSRSLGKLVTTEQRS